MYLKAYPLVVRQFWGHIRDGVAPGEAGAAVGVSMAYGLEVVCSRWWGEAEISWRGPAEAAEDDVGRAR